MEDDTLAARVRELEAELEMYRDLAGKPCKCDPPGSGEELCNTACELTQRLAEVERAYKFLGMTYDALDERHDTLKREVAELKAAHTQALDDLATVEFLCDGYKAEVTRLRGGE